MDLKNVTIGFIGTGNMGRALMEGILAAGVVAKDKILISRHNREKAADITKTYGVKAFSNKDVAAGSKICVLAVKPDKASGVLHEIASVLNEGSCVLSVVAGLSTKDAEEILAKNTSFIRSMPNTPTKVGAGFTGVSAGKYTTAEEMDTVMELLKPTGMVEVVDESKMDAVGGLSGSGPAYIFQIIEALSDGGVYAGLSRDSAIKMAAQTVLGAAKMVLDTGLHPGVLKDMVTSPGGTTIEGILAMEKGGVRKAMMEAVIASANKSKSMGVKK